MGKQKKRSAKEKLKIVLEGLQSDNISETCRQHGIYESQFYQWKDKLLESANEVFSRKYKKDPFVFFRFYKLFKEIEPDIVHSWNSMCSVYAMPATWILGTTFVNNFLRDAPAMLNIKDKNWNIEKNNNCEPYNESSLIQKGHIRSFQKRRGKITRGQRKALEKHYNTYCIPYAEKKLNFSQIFDNKKVDSENVA